MITILHGENITASRKSLGEFKNENKSKEIVTLNGKSLDLTDLRQAIEAKSLFLSEKLIIIENFIFKKGIIFDYLKSIPGKTQLIIWQDKEIKSSLLSQFKNVKVLKYKLPALIFKFLDSLSPDNAKNSLLLFKQLLISGPADFIFYMMIRQFRILLAIQSKVDIDEVKRLVSWQIGKFKRQASFFSFDQLLKIYQDLLIIDYQIKTGQSAQNLQSRLEYLLTDLNP